MTHDKPESGGPEVGVVTPAFNEEGNLRPLYEAVKAALEGVNVSFELLVVENGSSDSSLAVLKQLRAEDPRVQYLRLSRNFGHQGALTAGLAHCRGRAVVTMDADLQHPPDVLPRMIEKWREGFDVVIASAAENAYQPMMRRVINRIFYRTLAALSGLDLQSGLSDFRLMDRAAVDVLNRLPERARFLRGLARWIGFRQTSVAYEIAERHHGESKFTIRQLVRFGIDGVLGFSIAPLRLFLMLGFIVSGISLLYALYLVVIKLLYVIFGVGQKLEIGYATLAVGIFFLGGTILTAIGVLGEYIARIYEETKGRPSFVAWESSLDDDDGKS